MSIRSKFFVALAILFLLLAVTAVASVSGVRNIAAYIEESRQHLAAVTTLYQIRSVGDLAAQEAISLALASQITRVETGSTEIEELAENEAEELNEYLETLDTLTAGYIQLMAGLSEETEEVDALVQLTQNVGDAAILLAVVAETDDPSAITDALFTIETQLEAFGEQMDEVLAEESAHQQNLETTIQETTERAITLSLVFGGIMLATLGVGGYLLIRSVLQPVKQLQTAAQQVSRGNYSYRATDLSRDELGEAAQAFNTMAAVVQERDQTLTELNAGLEQRVDERTRQLQKAIAVAEENARVKSQFLANMSHELRTPLNAILGFTGIMMEGMGGDIDNDARYMVKRIQSNSSRLLDLIDSVLDLAKIEAGRIDIMYAPVDPRELADRWKAEVGVLAQQKNLSLDVKVDPAVPYTLLGDEARLTQIALNLLSNAVKFTATGGIKLNLGVKDDNWTLQVSDTGIGIPPHALNYIFEEFRQADGSTTRMYGGSGLGLAIVRNLCLMMNGTVRVSSQVGKGSTFTVTLPLTPVEEQEALLEA